MTAANQRVTRNRLWVIAKQIETPAPVIICLPGSFMAPNWGKDAPADLAGPLTKGNPQAYGRDFALAGYITLCPDYPCADDARIEIP